MISMKEVNNHTASIFIESLKSFFMLITLYLGNFVMMSEQDLKLNNINKNLFFILSVLIFFNSLHKIQQKK